MATPHHVASTSTASRGAEPSPAAGIRRLQVLLIKPSKYDDDGYVMRFVRGVLPSNTLAVLAGLTRQASELGLLGDVRVDILMLDEHVHKIDPGRLARRYLRPGVQPVVALCGVQTNQFPRAADLAVELAALGFPVMVGGFHVSGAIAMSATGMPRECQALLDQGVTLVKGEVEECWSDLLCDALRGELKAYYDVTDPPDLSRSGLPLIDPKLMKRFAYPYMGTIDAGRGCPFSCSFCTIINVQGRKMRHRLAATIKDYVRRNWDRKIVYYFFTDDNFSRNPDWEEILEALIELQRDEGIAVQFMMQIDVLAYRTERFVELAAAAGCSQVFIGMESLNPDNLAAAGKRQNRVADFRRMIRTWHRHGIACHVGYIIGFPADSAASVRQDVRRLRDEIGVDQASFFMLTPLPGSQDHAEMVQRGEWMADDYNLFDTFHPTTRHPKMSSDGWFGAYKDAWRDFYSVEGMKSILARATDGTYWGLFKNFVWYRHSALIEDTHPMICGFFRLKDRKKRRPGYAVEPRWTHCRKRTRELARWARDVVKLYFEMQEVWLATRGRARIQCNLEDLQRRYDKLRVRLGEAAIRARKLVRLQRKLAILQRRYEELRELLGVSATRAGEALGQQTADMRVGVEEIWERVGHSGRQAADELSLRLEKLRRCKPRALRPLRTPVWRRLARRLDPLAVRTQTRAHLDEYWRQTLAKLRRGLVFHINPVQLGVNFVRDARLCLAFNLTMWRAKAQKRLKAA